MEIKKFAFNDFQVNTYILYDETKECIIIDPACYYPSEKDALLNFIKEEQLKPIAQVYTHCHVDHVLGANFIFEQFNLKPIIHKAGAFLLAQTEQFAAMYGFDAENPIEPESFLEEGKSIEFGNTTLNVIYTPGHVDGSVCFIHQKSKTVITGDVLFLQSIGRTDLPTGNFEVLKNSIHQKLFTLDNGFTVYPGHGPETNIGHEKANNPFV